MMYTYTGCNCWAFSTLCSNVSSNRLSERMLGHLSCTFSLSTVCVSNVSSNSLHKRIPSHSGCTCLTFLQCAFLYDATNCLAESYILALFAFSKSVWNVSSNSLPERMHGHTGCIWLTLLHYVLWNESLNGLPERMHSHIYCIWSIFLAVFFL